MPKTPGGEQFKNIAEGRPISQLIPLSPRPSRRTSRTAFVAAEPEEDDPLLQFPPYRHAAPRRNSITPERQRAFIAALAATGIVTQAARTIGASLEALYRLRRLAGAEGFAAAWDKAIDLGVGRLEDCALQLAIEGEELPIVSAGQVLGTFRKHNFAHIRFMLSQRRGERYSEGRGSYAALVPGHPVYDKLRAQWQAEAKRKPMTPTEFAAFERKVLDLAARLREEFKRELALRGAEALLEEPDVERILADLPKGTLPEGYRSVWRNGLWSERPDDLPPPTSRS